MGKIKGYSDLFASDGSYITDPSYKEIIRLHEMLTKRDIPHDFVTFLDGWQVIYPADGKLRVADAVEHYGSYGSEADLLEIMGSEIVSPDAGDSVEGGLTADDVFERINRHYERMKHELQAKSQLLGEGTPSGGLGSAR